MISAHLDLCARPNEYLRAMTCHVTCPRPRPRPAAPSARGTGAPPAEGEGAAGNAYDLELTRTATLAPGSVTFVSGLAVYQVENTAGSSSFSLHLYSPPCAGLFCFSSA